MIVFAVLLVLVALSFIFYFRRVSILPTPVRGIQSSHVMSYLECNMMFYVLKFAIGKILNPSFKFKQLTWPSDKSVCLWSCRLGFDSERGRTNDFKIGIHSFPI